MRISRLWWLLPGLLLLVALIWSAAPAGAADDITNQFTIPTRTPPPGGGGGGDDGGGDSGGGGGEATAVPTATPSTGPTLPPAPTPVGGYLPTVEPCALPPVAQSLNIINVRGGPGINYPIVGEMIFLEVRAVTGRYSNGEWWQVALPGGVQGWVAGFVVNISGYTGLLPVLPAPPLNGATPTPGPAWNPTPNPTCAITVTPTATPEPNEAGGAPASSTPVPTPIPTNPPTVTPPTSQPATALAAAPTAGDPPSPQPAATQAPTAAPLAVDADAGGGSNWLLYGGLLLVLLGGVGFFVVGRRGA